MSAIRSGLYVVTSCVLAIGCGATAAPVPEPRPTSSSPAAHAELPQSNVPLAPLEPEPEDNPTVTEPEALSVEWFATPDARSIERCASDSPDLDAARAALTALDSAVVHAPRNGNGSSLRTQFVALLGLRCFAPAVEAALPVVRSVRSFEEWWTRSGRSWLEQYLSPFPERNAGDPRRQVILPAAERTLLSQSDLPRNHPLAPLLCSVSDATCGSGTSAFLVRAEQSFAAFHVASEHEHEAMRTPDERAMRDWHQRNTLCARDARRAPARSRYQTWYLCIQSHQQTADLFPIDRIRVPESGWIVMTGRRGHYHFCDETRAYDLATGAAYIAKSCSGLALESDGSVNAQATNDAREESVVTGRLPLFALRELAWMMLLADTVSPNAPTGDVAILPDNIEPVLPASGELFGTLSGMFVGHSSAQTTVQWSWIVDDRVRKTSEFTYPNSLNSAAENHIDELLAVAEAAFEPGCVPALLPQGLRGADELTRLLHGARPTLCE